MSIASMDLDGARAFIAKARWQYAKSMPKFPHEYSIKQWGADPSWDEEFQTFLHYIWHCGEHRKEYFWKRTYLDIDGYYYWSMGDPLLSCVTINRGNHTKDLSGSL